MVERVYIKPMTYLRTMLAIAWSAFRYPFSTTTIDLSTGKVISWALEKEEPPNG
jgi:hypothetical protein